MVKGISLTQGKVTLVDDADYEWLNQWKWYAHRSHPERKEVFYALRSDKRYTVAMHRLILDVPKGLQVDHINHNGLDNRRCNIRLCTQSQNTANSSHLRPNKTSQYRGVHWDKTHNRWRAGIRVNNKPYRLGRFTSEIDAARVYNRAALEHFGEFASLNALDS